VKLDVVVRWRGRVVDALQWRAGRTVRLGGDGVPVPEGADHVARLEWLGGALRGTEAGGADVRVSADHPARLSVGDVTLALDVSPRVRFRRWTWPSVQGSVAWFVVVLGLAVLAQQADVLWRHRCATSLAVFGRVVWNDWLQCDVGSAAWSGGIEAEVLQRLLREEFEGAERGVLFEDMDRPDIDLVARQVYIPAGQKGPLDRMGGAAEVRATPVRSPEQSARAGTDRPAVAPMDGPPVAPVPSEATEDEGADGSDGTDDRDAVAPAEEELGWGVKDWYDQADADIDQLEIRMMLREARSRLRIDPDDPYALSLLSYYQYLAEDYVAAEGTWDRYIGQLPEDAAGYNNKALIYKRRVQYAEEERLYLVALALQPDDVTAMNNLAVCYAHQGRFAEARALLDRLLVLDPDDAYADLHRAKVAAAEGHEEEAMSWLEKSLSGMARLDTLHHIEYRQDIRVDPAFAALRKRPDFHRLMAHYYGKNAPISP
jgi:thioredoxin-like negative regulator of GroEL